MPLIPTEPSTPIGRPEPGEYAAYASTDIASVPGDDAIEALAQLQERTTAFFRALAEPANRGFTYAPGKWPLKSVLGHLIDDERIFVYRLLCVARGENGELPGFIAVTSCTTTVSCSSAICPCSGRTWRRRSSPSRAVRISGMLARGARRKTAARIWPPPLWLLQHTIPLQEGAV